MTWRGCARPLCREYDVALVDLDGVAYVGDHAVPHAADALAAAREAGMRAMFVTNNASREPGDVAAHLRRLGVPAGDNDVVTSAQAAASLLARELGPGARVLVAGAPALRSAVEAAGLRPVSSAGDKPEGVVSGFDPTLDYQRLAEAALAVRAGAWWVASNVDATLPTPRGELPGNGALVALVRTATGVEPAVAGKPRPALFEEAVRRAGGGRALVIGDRLDTDIAGANAAGCDSLLVFTGVATPAALLRAVPAERPTFVGADLRALLRPHPAVAPDGQGTPWRAGRDGDGLVTLGAGPGSQAGAGLRDGPGSPLDVDAVRAACAAWWALAGEGTAPGGVRALDEAARGVMASLGLPVAGDR